MVLVWPAIPYFLPTCNWGQEVGDSRPDYIGIQISIIAITNIAQCYVRTYCEHYWYTGNCLHVYVCVCCLLVCACVFCVMCVFMLQSMSNLALHTKPYRYSPLPPPAGTRSIVKGQLLRTSLVTSASPSEYCWGGGWRTQCPCCPARLVPPSVKGRHCTETYRTNTRATSKAVTLPITPWTSLHCAQSTECVTSHTCHCEFFAHICGYNHCMVCLLTLLSEC